ncbi:MAG: septum formation initiator family protein [Coriobacteriia bacterium]
MPWLLPLVSAGLVIAFIVTCYPVARVQYREVRRKAQLEAQLTALQERNDRLRQQVASLETTAGVEDYARSQLGMVKAGEHAVIVTDSSGSVPTSTISPSAKRDIDCAPVATEPTGAWTAFLDFVFQVK